MAKMRNALFAALVGLASVQVAQADVAYTSPEWAQVNTTPTGTDAWCSSCGSTWQVADSFTLAAGGTITGVSVGIQDDFGSNWNPTVSIWNSSLTTQLFSQSFSWGSFTSTDNPSAGVAVFDFSLSGLTLGAGTYYISWYDGSNMGVPTWLNSNNSLVQTQTPGDWSNVITRDGGAAFQIYTSAVPEPETYAMMMAGLGLLGAVARRRKA